MQLDNRVLIDQVEDLARILHLWNEQIIIGGGVALVLYDLQKINMTMGHVAVELVE